jgi:hypothetical protein
VNRTPRDGFGRAYRCAVFERVSSMRAVVLAWVLLDEAYTQRSLTFAIGQRLLCDETRLYRRDLVRACDDLVAAGLLRFVVPTERGRNARTLWTLIDPEDIGSEADVFDFGKARPTPRTRNARPNARQNARPNARATPRTLSLPGPAAAAESGEHFDENPAELLEALRPLEALEGNSLDGRGRADVVHAFEEDPDGTLALIGRYVQRGRAGRVSSPGGALIGAIGRGEYRDAGERRKRSAPCPECGVGGGQHAADCPTLEHDAGRDRRKGGGR